MVKIGHGTDSEYEKAIFTKYVKTWIRIMMMKEKNDGCTHKSRDGLTWLKSCQVLKTENIQSYDWTQISVDLLRARLYSRKHWHAVTTTSIAIADFRGHFKSCFVSKAIKWG
jgi:hypothetical protein